MTFTSTLPVLGLLAAIFVGGCAAPEETDAEEEGDTTSALSARAGTNGDTCKRSAYNCSLRAGGQRVKTASGSESWAVDAAYIAANKGVPVVDGNGDSMGVSDFTKFTLNYGQSRIMNGTRYVYAMSTGLASSGWVPMAAFRAADSLAKQVGNMDGKGDNLAKLGCYTLASKYDNALDSRMVVKGDKVGSGAEANDYLPQVRKNGKVYGTLSFNAPGDALGGANLDIFPVGTKFQRVDVPTWEKPSLPSLDVKLYSGKKGSAANTSAGEMKFIYGYIRSATGEVRYGWAAIDGLNVSSNCDAR